MTQKQRYFTVFLIFLAVLFSAVYCTIQEDDRAAEGLKMRLNEIKDSIEMYQERNRVLESQVDTLLIQVDTLKQNLDKRQTQVTHEIRYIDQQTQQFSSLESRVRDSILHAYVRNNQGTDW